MINDLVTLGKRERTPEIEQYDKSWLFLNNYDTQTQNK
jgi:hypothetical protein